VTKILSFIKNFYVLLKTLSKGFSWYLHYQTPIYSTMMLSHTGHILYK